MSLGVTHLSCFNLLITVRNKPKRHLVLDVKHLHNKDSFDFDNHLFAKKAARKFVENLQSWGGGKGSVGSAVEE